MQLAFTSCRFCCVRVIGEVIAIGAYLPQQRRVDIDKII